MRVEFTFKTRRENTQQTHTRSKLTNTRAAEESGTMASVSVVGQHRLDSEPLLYLKVSDCRKTITMSRRSSREKMGYGRGESAAQSSAPGPALETAARGGRMPAEGCGAPAGHAAPRSPGGGDEGTAATRKSQTWRSTDGCNRNIDCDTNYDSASRRGTSLTGSGAAVMPNGSAAHGHRRACRHREEPHGRRDSRNGESGALRLERVTQGRTGVVKLARPEPRRVEAWTIFTKEGMDPRVKTEKGEGHRFVTRSVTQDFCDACSRQITAQALKCQNCSYTCHLECQSQIQLDCNQRDRKPEETPPPRIQCSSTTPQHQKNESKEEEVGGTKDLSEEEVRSRIEDYNAQVSENGMTLAKDGSYTGFIKVHLRLSRPVTVPEGGSRQGQESKDGGHTEKRTSFYLPSDCVKQLHISSLTTTGQVIQGLLKKFMVLDNPCKFALYRQTHRDGQDLFQKLPPHERPLLLRLIAGPDPDQLSFVLKENETGDVEWHAFSVPELQNFLIILEKEEVERIRAVKQKYTVYREKLEQALKQHDP